ncbi:MAG: transglutaminase domain-containing protein [bacterium]
MTPDLTRRRCRALAELYARHPLWRDVLAEVIPGVDGNDRHATARALWSFVHRRVAFQPEIGEQIQTPATTIRRLMGDCDDQHTLLLALYLSVLLPARGVLLRIDDAGRYHADVGQPTPGRAFHIWTQVLLGGVWVDAETVHPSIGFGQSPVDAIRRGLTIR